MTFTLPLVLLGGGLWLLLLGGCILFLMLSVRFKQRLFSEQQQTAILRKNLARSTNNEEGFTEAVAPIEAPVAKPIADQQIHAEVFAVEREALQAQINTLQAQLEAQLSTAGADTANAKYQKKARALKDTLDSVKDDLADAEDQIATLDGANQALQAERDSLERQLQSLAETIDATSDAETMREMIVNFTEESRELLEVIEQLGKEKAELQQKIADMEAGGKGTAGAVIGLKRKLDEAQAELQQLKGEGGNSAAK